MGQLFKAVRRYSTPAVPEYKTLSLEAMNILKCHENCIYGLKNITHALSGIESLTFEVLEVLLPKYQKNIVFLSCLTS
jgi:hypothetical protein